MIHLCLGKEIQRDTKTGCNLLLENLPRADASVSYKQRGHVTCKTCKIKTEKIATLRGEK